MRPISAGVACLSACLIAAMTGATETPPAFPGAEGFGARTPGGRGGRVLIVRTLDDSGPGSLREALAAKGPRIVVFRVGGLIALASPIEIAEPYLTIGGQTAPGDGICIRGRDVVIRTHDVVVRHIRFRPGDVSGAEVDGLSIGGGAHDVIVDHCSAGWSVDESLSLAGDVRDVTVQWSLIAEALNNSVHHKGEHGYGSLMRANGGVTLHHNLWAHNIARNPRLGDNYLRPPFPTFDVRNNVIYDYGQICSGMTGDRLSANYVGNYIRPGPSSQTKRGVIVLTDTAAVAFHVAGNVVEGRPELSANDRRLFDKADEAGRVTIAEKPFDAPRVRTTAADEALHDVLAGAGATRPRRDVADARIVREAETRGGRIIDSQREVGGWPDYATATPPLDTDEDGMPDAWERARGLDPRDPRDGSAVGNADGYTNLEIYLNELADRPPEAGSTRKPGAGPHPAVRGAERGGEE
jgi:pectate lyase